MRSVKLPYYVVRLHKTKCKLSNVEGVHLPLPFFLQYAVSLK